MSEARAESWVESYGLGTILILVAFVAGIWLGTALSAVGNDADATPLTAPETTEAPVVIPSTSVQ